MEKHSKKSSYLPTTAPPPTNSRHAYHHHDSAGEGCSPNQSPSKSASRLLKRRSHPFWNKVRNFVFILAAIVNVGISIYIVIEHGNLPELFPGEHETSGRVFEAKKCHLPQLVANSPEMKSLMHEAKRIDCGYAANTDFKGRIFFKTDYENRLIRVAHPGTIPCCWRPFFRVNDNEVWIEPTKTRRYVCHNITEAVTPIPKEYEFIEVICDDTRRSYKDGFNFIQKKPEVEERIRKHFEKEKEEDPYGPKLEKLSVIILGIGSTSQQNFIRRMPKSLEMLKTLGAVRLDGYVKVGDETLSNVVPLLTGMGLNEFKDLCVMKDPPMDSAVHLDACPFIWKHFKNAGYRTFFAEDEVSKGIFNMDWSHAFLEPPTDHYFRPFSLRMVTTQNVYDGFCFGPRMSFQVLLQNLEKSATTYPKEEDLMFHLSWISKLTQEDFNYLGWGDSHLLRTLRFLQDQGKLNHSALFILSDHGSRDAELRKTRQGQLEDRLPLAYIILPQWFSQKYPQAVKNLRGNANQITSAYDMFETFKDLTDLSKLNDQHIHYIRQRKLKVAEKKSHRRGTSLFTQLPEHRGCVSAGIPPHWCICYKKKKISIKSLDVHDALSYVLRNINNQLRPYNNICSKLKLGKVISALKMHPEEAIEDTFNGNTEESYKKASLLQIKFEAIPPPAQFEVTVIFDPDHGWKFTEQILRLDNYAESSHCMTKHQELKYLCVCLNEDPPESDHLEGGQDFPIF